MTANWFIAMPIAPGVWFERLRAQAPDGLRFSLPDDLHLTLAFLGPVGEDAALGAWSSLARQELMPASDVVLGGMKALGNPKRPSALAVVLGAGAQPVLDLIVRMRDHLIAAAGGPPERRPPLPHITVARITRKARSQARDEALAWVASRPPLNAVVTVDQIALYTRSQEPQEPQERRFRRVRTVDL